MQRTRGEWSDTRCFLRELLAAVLLAGAVLLVLHALAGRLGWLEENGDHGAGATPDAVPAERGEGQLREWVGHAGMVPASGAGKYVRWSAS